MNAQIQYTQEMIPVRTIAGKYGFMDNSGNIVIPCVYDEPIVFYDGLANVKCNGKYGFIDERGNILVPFIYEEV